MDRIIEDVKMIFGMDLDQVLAVKLKLDILGVNISDIKEFLDRDKVLLFAELKTKIRNLENKLTKIRKVAG